MRQLLSYLEYINEGIDKMKLHDIGRLSSIKDEKYALQLVSKLIRTLQDKLRHIRHIRFVGDKSDIRVDFGKHYQDKINYISSIFVQNPFLYDYYPHDIEFNTEFIISINDERLNQIDIITEIPYFMRGYGVGKKVYKALIMKYGYISSTHGNNHSKSSDMVWDSILKDDEIYSFIFRDNFISFDRRKSYRFILFYLKRFYPDNIERMMDDVYLFDDVFLKDYGKTVGDVINDIRGYISEEYNFRIVDNSAVYCYDENDINEISPLSKFIMKGSKLYEDSIFINDENIYERIKEDVVHKLVNVTW